MIESAAVKADVTRSPNVYVCFGFITNSYIMGLRAVHHRLADTCFRALPVAFNAYS